MADFKDVIIRLQENKNDNREVIQEQTTVLSSAFKEAIKSQNRSFGQSLSRQQQKSSDALSGIASMLGQQTQITKDVTKDDDVVEKQSVGGLEAIAIILTDILGVLNTSLAINQQMADEQERLKLLNQGKAPGVAGGDGGGDDGEETGKSGKGLIMAGIGALAGAALTGAKGIAMMGVAISAFFGGLVAGNAALDYLDADLNFTKIKEAAKGFSGIVAELTPEAMVALGAIMGVSAIGGTKAAKGVGAFGFGISAFFGGLLAGDALFSGVSALGADLEFTTLKKVVAGFGSIIDEMSIQTRTVLGAMLVAGTALGFTSAGSATKAALGIAALGAGIGGFFVGLALADTLVEGIDYLTGAADLSNIKKVTESFGGIIEGLDASTLTAIGGLIVAGAALGTVSRNPARAGMGVASLGAGIGGFFIGLAVGDAAMGWLNSDFTNIAKATAGFSFAISNLTDEAMVALGALLAAGGILGAVTTPATQAKFILGIGALSGGIAAFFLGFAATDFIAANVGDGSSAVTLMSNFSAAIGALDTNALTGLSVLLGAGAIFGATGLAGPAAFGMGMIGAGIAAFFLAFEGLTKVGDIIGLDGSSTKKLINNMTDGLFRLQDLNGENLLKVVPALSGLGAAVLKFMGAEGLGGLASGAVNAAKDGFNYLKSFFFDPETEGEGETMIDRMVEMIKPLEDFDVSGLEGFISASNALTDFLTNDYRKGADDFEYFVNKVAGLAPALEAGVFGGEYNGIEFRGLAEGGEGYIAASKNIMMLKNALNDSQVELSATQAEATAGAGGNVNASSTSVQNTNVNSQSTYSVASSVHNHEKTVGMMNNVNGRYYSITDGEDF